MRILANTIIIILITVVGLELTAFAAVSVLSKAPLNDHLRFHAARFHPLFRKDADREDAAGNPIPLYQRSDKRSVFAYDPHTGYTNRANASYGKGLNTDPQGFVCTSACGTVPRVKPEGEFRIAVIGGSTVVGVGVDAPEQTMVARLEQQILANWNRPDLKPRVINAGVGGFFSPQELIRLDLDVWSYSPDLVVIFDGYNDANQWFYVNYYPYISRYKDIIQPNLHSYDYGLIEGIDRLQTPAGAVLHTLNILNDSYPLLYYTTVLAKHVRASAAGWGAAAPASAAAVVRPGEPPVTRRDHAPALRRLDRNSVATYMGNLDSMTGSARGRNVPVLACLQPTLAFTDPDGHPFKKAVTVEEEKMSEWGERAPAMTAFFTAAAEEFATRRGRQDDLTRLFAETDGPIYKDEIHYNAEGQAMLAGAIYAQLRPLLTTALAQVKLAAP